MRLHFVPPWPGLARPSPGMTASIAGRRVRLNAWHPVAFGAVLPRLGTWRALGFCWLGILACLGGLAATLQVLGPPVARKPVAAVVAPAKVAALPRRTPGRDAPGPVAGPDAALLEPLPAEPTRFLPRIAADGRAPMAVYAAGFAPGTHNPRVGLILAGVGLDHPASEAAVHDLPGAITLAISPYARDLDPLLEAARAGGHEYLLSIPMEPRGYPLDDPGDHALMTALPAQENLHRLDWALSRMGGYVGATGALGRLRGEHFAAEADLMNPILQAIAGRGLLYIDPRPEAGRLPSVWGRRVDVVVDDAEPTPAIDAQLAALSRIARERGSALGLVGAVRPATVARIAAWADQLASQGITLAPASALVEKPAPP